MVKPQWYRSTRECQLRMSAHICARTHERTHVNHWHRNRRKWKRIIEFSGYWHSERRRIHRFAYIGTRIARCPGNAGVGFVFEREFLEQSLSEQIPF